MPGKEPWARKRNFGDSSKVWPGSWPFFRAFLSGNRNVLLGFQSFPLVPCLEALLASIGLLVRGACLQEQKHTGPQARSFPGNCNEDGREEPRSQHACLFRITRSILNTLSWRNVFILQFQNLTNIPWCEKYFRCLHQKTRLLGLPGCPLCLSVPSKSGCCSSLAL